MNITGFTKLVACYIGFGEKYQVLQRSLQVTTDTVTICIGIQNTPNGS